MTLHDLLDQHARNHQALLQLSADHGQWDGFAMTEDLEALAKRLALLANELQLRILGQWMDKPRLIFKSPVGGVNAQRRKDAVRRAVMGGHL